MYTICTREIISNNIIITYIVLSNREYRVHARCDLVLHPSTSTSRKLLYILQTMLKTGKKMRQIRDVLYFTFCLYSLLRCDCECHTEILHKEKMFQANNYLKSINISRIFYNKMTLLQQHRCNTTNEHFSKHSRIHKFHNFYDTINCANEKVYDNVNTHHLVCY